MIHVFTPHIDLTNIDSDSDSDFDVEETEQHKFATSHRLTDFLMGDNLSDLDQSESEAEIHLGRLCHAEEDRISHAEAKLDPDWKPKQGKKQRKQKIFMKDKSEDTHALQVSTTDH